MIHELHQKALECVKNYKRSEKELIDILQEIDQTKSYLQHGVSSLFRYCVERLGLAESETHRLTQVSRKSFEVPELKKAIADGRLTVSKASRIAPVITKDTQVQWIEKASTLKQRELEKEVSKFNPKPFKTESVKVLTPEVSELKVSISNETYELLKRSQEVLKTAGFEKTIHEALAFFLKHKDPLEKAKRTASRTEATSVKNISSSVLPSSRKIGAQAEKMQVGRPLRQPIPAYIRHQVFLRDQGKCQYKSCHETRWVQIHHQRPLALGGSNTLENLLTLCSRHHNLMHV